MIFKINYKSKKFFLSFNKSRYFGLWVIHKSLFVKRYTMFFLHCRAIYMNFWSLRDGEDPKCYILVTIYTVTWRWGAVFLFLCRGTDMSVPLIKESLLCLRPFLAFTKMRRKPRFFMSYFLQNRVDWFWKWWKWAIYSEFIRKIFPFEQW